MIVTVNSQKLVVELRLLNKIVPNQPAIAILSHALLAAEGEGLHMFATDLEIGLGTACHARVDEPGRTALPVAKLLAMVEQFPDDDVILTSDAKQTVIRCGAFRSRLQALNADDFPRQPAAEAMTNALDGNLLRQLIDRTRYAVAATATKHVLQGALLKMVDQAVAMVSTDGKRLALTTGAVEGGNLSVIVPAKMLDVLSSQLIDGPVEMTLGEQHSFFMVDGRLLSSRTFDAEFPRYERIVPKDNDKRIEVNRAAFAAALRRVIVAADNNGAVYLGIEGQRMEMTSSSVEVGTADEAVPVAYDGPEMKVCINGNYVLDFLNAAGGQTVTLLLKDARSAAMLMDGDDYVGVIMLMRGPKG